MRTYYPEHHANKAMVARRITWAQVLHVLAAPEVSYSNTQDSHADTDTTLYQRGDLFVVARNTPRFHADDIGKEQPLYPVVTTGLRSTEQWTNQDVRDRSTK